MLTAGLGVAVLIYDWLLCLDQEVRFMWTLRSQRVKAVSSLVYLFSRYALILELLLIILTIYPMSDLVRHLAESTITVVPSNELIIIYRGT